MEEILHRKIVANQERSIPMTRDVIQTPAVEIFQRLIRLHLFDENGERVNRTTEIGSEIQVVVQAPHNLYWHADSDRNNTNRYEYTY